MGGAVEGTAISSPVGQGAAAHAFAKTVAFFRACLERDRTRLGLWAPFFLGSGAGIYLTLKVEPVFAAAPIVAVIALGIAVASERLRLPALGVLCVALGILIADLRAASVAAPVLVRELGFVHITGRLLAIEEGDGQRRIIIRTKSIDRLTPEETPAKVRLTWRGSQFDAAPGDLIEIRASLSPPPPPTAPDGYDFARHLYFQGIGGIGFAVSPPVVLTKDKRPSGARIAGAIEALRVGLTRRIVAAAPGDAGAIVATVVTGKRAGISEEGEAIFRDSGLTHLLSISGLHMALATGIVFVALRALFALIPALVLRHPVKKWAAIAALLSGAAYLVVSGMSWPAQRAYIMTAIVFIAIIFDRRAFSLRNVAIAAFVIIILAPEAVLNPGFQMSFAAVTALIAAHEWSSKRLDPARSFSALARARRYVVGVAATDIISSAATAPYSLFHFNRAANFGLPANLISIPLMGFWVMPLAIVALVMTPFGVDGAFWRLAAGGVEIMLALGAWTRELPGAIAIFPKWPDSVPFIVTLGGLWLCLLSAPWRLFGLAALPIAATVIALAQHPDIFVSADGDNAGFVVQTADGKRALALFEARKTRFAAHAWTEQSGFDQAKVKPARLEDFAPCDAEGCVARIDGAVVAVSRLRSGLDDDCARADLVIAVYVASPRERENCAALLIDKRRAWEGGSHAVFIDDGRVRIVSTAQRRGDRAWSAQNALQSAGRKSGITSFWQSGATIKMQTSGRSRLNAHSSRRV
jgi:competence protein ComEC